MTPIPLTEREYIKNSILKAAHTDNLSETDINILTEDLYKSLFGFRDSRKESPLDRPSAYPLQVIFEELKYGRPAASQQYLQKCIDELNAQ